jgi:hypothetical protein
MEKPVWEYAYLQDATFQLAPPSAEIVGLAEALPGRTGPAEVCPSAPGRCRLVASWMPLGASPCTRLQPEIGNLRVFLALRVL